MHSKFAEAVYYLTIIGLLALWLVGLELAYPQQPAKKAAATDSAVAEKLKAVDAAKARAATAKSKATDLKSAADKLAQDAIDAAKIASTAANDSAVADKDVLVAVADADLAKAQLVYQLALEARDKASGGVAPMPEPVEPPTKKQLTSLSPGKLRLTVPALATVTINDQPTTKQGTEREYDTPPLAEGATYSYVVSVTDNGKTTTRVVPVKAGTVAREDFTK